MNDRTPKALFPARYRVPVGALESISLAGTSVLTFRPQDLLLIICMNGTKDVWKSLKQICDVASNPRSSGARLG